MALKDIAYIGARPRRAKLLTVPESIFEEQARVMSRAQHLFAKPDPYGRERKLLPGTIDLTSHGLSLLGVLRRLNVTPLDPVSVRQYQASKERHWIERSGGIRACEFAFWPCLAVFLYTIYTHWTMQHDLWSSAQTATALLTGFGAVIFGSGAFGHDFGHRTQCDLTWTRTLLEHYGFDRVPLFAIDTAVKIKEAMPDCEVYVEDIHLNRKDIRKPVHDIDPFLIVKQDSEEYYVECWYEKDFERTI